MARAEGYGATLYQRPPVATGAGRRFVAVLVVLVSWLAVLAPGPAAAVPPGGATTFRAALSEQRPDGARITVVAPAAHGRDAPPADRIQVLDSSDEEPLDATVTALPEPRLEVVLVVDVSGGPATVESIQGGLREFILSLPEGTAVSVVAAGEEPRLVASATRSPTSALAGLALLAPTEPSLPEAAIDLGLDQLSGSPGTRPVVVEVRTGGYRSVTGSAAPLQPTRDRLAEGDVDVYAVQLGTMLREGRDELPVPVRGGFVLEARSNPALVGALDAIARDLSLPRYQVDVALRRDTAIILRARWRGVVSQTVTIGSPRTAPRPEALPAPAGPRWSRLGAAVAAAAVVVAVVLVPPWRRRRRLAREAALPPPDPGLRVDEVGASIGGRPTDVVPETGLGGEDVEGAAAVRALLATGTRPVAEVWLGSDLDGAVRAELEALAARRRVPVRAGSRPGTALPVAARALPLVPARLEALWSAAPRAVVLAVAGSPAPVELGRALAAADPGGAGRDEAGPVTGVVLPRQPTSRITAAATAAAAGAVDRLPLALVPDLGAALAAARAAGARVLGVVPGATGAGAEEVGRDVAGPTVVVVAAGDDLERSLRARCDAVVAIAGRDLAQRVAAVVAALGPEPLVDLRQAAGSRQVR